MSLPALTPRLRALLTAAALVVLTGAPAEGFRKAALNGEAVMERVMQRHGATTELDLVQLVTTDADGHRQTRRFLGALEVRADGTLRYLIRVIEPEALRGAALLSIEEAGREPAQWLYLPEAGPARRLDGASGDASFLGSAFTFRDFRREPIADHSFRLSAVGETVSGLPCYRVQSSSRKASLFDPAGYAHRQIFVDKQTYAPVKIEFFDASRELLRTFTGYDFRGFAEEGKRLRPMRMEMADHRDGTHTQLRLLATRSGLELPERLFQPEELGAWTPAREDALLEYFGSDIAALMAASAAGY